MRISLITKTILLSALIFVAAHQALASETNGTITSGGNNGYAWSNQAGWVNFGCSNCGISITDSGITGYAWNNNHGWINMSPANGGVFVAANGALSGYAWGSGLGWINFSGASINSSGKFVGTASGTTIGTLSFDCANCSVTTDFRAQNFRTVAPAPTTVVSGVVSVGGGGGIIGGGVGAPSHINAFNVPMKLFPAQSGTLTQNLANQKSIILDAPNNVYSDDITFIIKEETVFPTISPTVSVIGNALFSITARDRANDPVRSFLKPVKITLNVPELLRGRSDLGLYFFDDATRVWVKILDAVFSGDSVSFHVNHLTLFAIFAGPELSLTIEAPFQLPPQFQFEIPRIEIELPREGVEAPEGEVPTTEIVSEENPPLFDIEINPGPLESKRARTLIVITITIVAAVAAAAMYLFRKRREHDL